MIDRLVMKKMMSDEVSPQEVFDVVVKLSVIATKHVDNKVELAK